MVANQTLLALSVSSTLDKSPLIIMPHSLGAAELRIKDIQMSFSFPHFFVSLIPFSGAFIRSCFNNLLSSPFHICATANGQTYTSRQDVSSNTSISFIQCQFLECSTTSLGSAIYLSSSSSNISISKCSFIKCISNNKGCNAGAVDIYCANGVQIVSSTFSYCSSYEDVSSVQVGSQCGGIKACDTNYTTFDLCGKYGYNSDWGANIGASYSLNILSNNFTSSIVESCPSGLTIINFKASTTLISFLNTMNNSGPSFFGLYCSTDIPSVKSANFFNNTVSTGWIQFYKTSSLEADFIQCSFGGMSSNTLSFSTGTVSSTHLYFLRCCFETEVPSAYTAGHSFNSTIIGNCINSQTLDFTTAQKNGNIANEVMQSIVLSLITAECQSLSF